MYTESHPLQRAALRVKTFILLPSASHMSVARGFPFFITSFSLVCGPVVLVVTISFSLVCGPVVLGSLPSASRLSVAGGLPFVIPSRPIGKVDLDCLVYPV